MRYSCVAFWDQFAACQLEIAKCKCTKLGMSIDEAAATRLKDDTYVDDGVTGGSREEVLRFRGEKLANGGFNRSIPRILGLGGLNIKAMIISGESDHENMEQLGDSVLGIKYEPEQDVFNFESKMEVHKKKR